MIFLPMLLGGAVRFLAQRNAANRREDIAQLNYQIDANNARIDYGNRKTQLQLDNISSRIELDASRTNLRLALADADARERNAERLRMFAKAKSKQGREALRRQMREYDEFQSSQSAAVGASGVVMGGSAMEVLLESAEQFRIQIQDEHERQSFERLNTLQDAEIEEIGADRDRAGARAGFDYAKTSHKLRLRANRLGRTSAKTAFQAAMMEAEVSRLSQNDQARGQRLGATGQLLGTAGSFITQRYQYKQNSPS